MLIDDTVRWRRRRDCMTTLTAGCAHRCSIGADLVGYQGFSTQQCDVPGIWFRESVDSAPIERCFSTVEQMLIASVRSWCLDRRDSCRTSGEIYRIGKLEVDSHVDLVRAGRERVAGLGGLDRHGDVT